MLVLTRNSQEKIIIGDRGEIEIVVLAVQGTSVRLGVKAPNSVPIDRKEVYLSKAERQQTTQ